MLLGIGYTNTNIHYKYFKVILPEQYFLTKFENKRQVIFKGYDFLEKKEFVDLPWNKLNASLAWFWSVA